MNIDFSDDQKLLQSEAKKFLEKEQSVKRSRGVLEGSESFDKDLSKKLSSSFSVSAIEGMDVKSSGMNSDMHASAEYRANLVSLYAKKAVEAC